MRQIGRGLHRSMRQAEGRVVGIGRRIGNGDVVFDDCPCRGLGDRDLSAFGAGVQRVQVVVPGGVVADRDIVALKDLNALAAIAIDKVVLDQRRKAIGRVTGPKVAQPVDDDAVAVGMGGGHRGGHVVVADVAPDDGPKAPVAGIAGQIDVRGDRDAAGLIAVRGGVAEGAVVLDDLELGQIEGYAAAAAVMDGVVAQMDVMTSFPVDPVTTAAHDVEPLHRDVIRPDVHRAVGALRRPDPCARFLQGPQGDMAPRFAALPDEQLLDIGAGVDKDRVARPMRRCQRLGDGGERLRGRAVSRPLPLGDMDHPRLRHGYARQAKQRKDDGSDHPSGCPGA